MLGVSWYQSATLFIGNRLTVGFDYQHFGGESWNRMVSTGERIPGVDKQMDEFAGYVDFRQDLGEWLSLDAGIRDVYKRQGQTPNLCVRPTRWYLSYQSLVHALPTRGMTSTTLWYERYQRLVPVSYTHLDVYKRQL